MPDGFEQITLPDGRIAFALIPVVPSILPFWAQSIASLNDQPVSLATGVVAGGTVIASIPFKYKKTFRLKSDRIENGWGAKRLVASAGSPGFYGAAFNSLGQPNRMLCVFPANAATPYKIPECFLRWSVPVSGATARSVQVFSNLPTFYQARTQNGSELVAPGLPLDLEDADVAIAHDFRLLLSVRKWKDGKPMVRWMSDDVVVQDETLEPGPDGQYSFPVNGGTVTLAPGTDKKSDTVVTFVPRRSGGRSLEPMPTHVTT